MKLTFWRIAGLTTHKSFAIHDIVVRSGCLQLSLANVTDEQLRLKLTFSDHLGFMICDEFGMDRYIATASVSGANFFIAEDSEFKELRNRGKVEPYDWSKITSYVIVDTDFWIEVLSEIAPQVEF
jgi:hypothetical protein